VYEAAVCLLRYLKRLPEPVVPYDFYDKFTSILGPTTHENDDGYDRDAFSVNVELLQMPSQTSTAADEATAISETENKKTNSFDFLSTLSMDKMTAGSGSIRS